MQDKFARPLGLSDKDIERTKAAAQEKLNLNLTSF
tara:strand:+ start:489 stop:593 length:105 start_codon:yes stop_codon:yes gene_type:complete